MAKIPKNGDGIKNTSVMRKNTMSVQKIMSLAL